MFRINRFVPAALLLVALAGCQDVTDVAPGERPAPPGLRPAMASAVTTGSYVDVTAGGNFSCGLRSDGTIRCWGGNNAGQLYTPTGTFKRIDAGIFENNVCAIRTDDTLVCWGASASIGLPPSGTYSDVSVGLVHACALATDGTIDCWGGNQNGQSNAPAGSDFVQVAAGYEYTCALRADGTIACWGFAGAGQMSTPTHLGPFTAVSASYAATCAIRSNGELVCWGRGFGGVGGETDPPDGGVWHGLDGGSVGGCALDAGGTPACWSADLQPREVLAGPFTVVDQGAQHACAVDAAGSVSCWGNPADNRLDANSEVPVYTGFISNGKPVSAFNVPEGSPLTMGFVVGGGEGGYTYSWSVADPQNPLANVTGETLTHTFVHRGTYTVTLTATSSTGGTIERTATVVVSNVPPTATVVVPETAYRNRKYTVSVSNVTDISPVSRAEGLTWRYLCGSTASPFGTLASFECTAPVADQATVTVQVWDGASQGTATATVPLIDPVEPNVAPTATFPTPAPVNEGSTYTLALTDPIDENTATLRYEFRCRPSTSYALRTVGSFTCPRFLDDTTFTVVARVRDAEGLFTEYEETMVVQNVAPTVKPFTGGTIALGEAYTRAGGFTDPSTLDTHTATVDYGSGPQPLTIGAGRSFALAHTFTRAGTYTVTVAVTDDDGGTGTYQATVIVIGPNQAPTASFTAPASAPEGSGIALALADVQDEDAATVTYAFDCGTGYGSESSSAAASCPTTDDGTITVRGRVTDAEGLSAEYSAAVSVTNAAPTVSALTGATIMAGETYTGSGSFTDPGADTHTATVDYGSGAQALALAGGSFQFQHTYAAAGSYTVTVTVTDDDGGQGTAQAAVTVLSPAQAADALTESIDAMVSAGVLSASEASSLNTSLESAIESMTEGNTGAAENKLNAFKNKVDALVRSRRITSSTGDQLKGYANRIIASMK